MPLYDFECIACKTVFEKELPMGSSVPGCPSCNGKMERLLSPPPVIFKGEGFYKTLDSKQHIKTATESEKNESAALKEKEENKPKTTDSPTKTAAEKPKVKE